MSNTLDTLLVFDELIVGPIKLESNRVTAPYTLIVDGTRDTFELIYRFEEAVFDPSDPVSQNLAAMMAVQPALNYGLFCRKLVFHGMFDDPDRRFLRVMAENTAREITVKKFLQPNRFITGPAADLAAEKRQRFCQALITFPNAPRGSALPDWSLWPTKSDRYAVLSSGGKDSLLTYGLMAEAVDATQGEVHPIFVNESGRHWFTALNAYRHFTLQVPHTARVWVNSDRLFNWMLRHMPFVRKDFSDVRSDEYPIRLWTVAVFLFGVIPLMRKRQLSCLLVGDEFDTTVRGRYKGIPHYDGLYDQSIHFDNALSRYFLQKGWAIRQFSILRPLSELLIESMLVKRYPDLQRLQISCHAAHEHSGSIKPCGRCEKCRRIVSMLLAVDADPRACGYTREQIDACLKLLGAKGVHQEDAGVQHLLHLLVEKKRIDFQSVAHFNPAPRPELLQMRFDSEHSPVNAIPRSLRGVLWRIFLQHTNGAVQRRGRKWESFDVLHDPALFQPYLFDMEPMPYQQQDDNDRSSRSRFIWGELNWPDAEALFKVVDIALLPVGAIEQHGPHLPLDTDAFDADYLAKRVAETCSDPRPLVLPLVPYGVSYHHDEFKGTISISNETLSRLVYDIGMAVAGHGIRKLVIINGHGGNDPALNFAAQMINRDARIFVCVDTGETSDVDIEAIVKTNNDVHAGEIETSTTLAVRPELVHMERAESAVPEFSSKYLDFSSKRGINWYAYTRRISDTGVMGDPTKSTAAKGDKIWTAMIAHLVAFVEDLKQLSLDEIHHRRL